MGKYTPKELISKVCMFVVCKYHKIGRYDDDMYIKRYVGMLIIYIYEVSIRSAENIYMYKVQKTC